MMGSKPASGGPSKAIQFDWRRQWRRRVMPHLELPQVRFAVELGMKLYNRNWTWADGPHAIGNLTGQRAVRGKLSWYQPWGRCHWIAFFACAIGVLNYPQLDWRFLTGDCHTVPVGYAEDGEPFVVMDILNFDSMTAEASIEWTRLKLPNAPKTTQWHTLFEMYRTHRVPELRAAATDHKRESIG